MRKLGLPEPPRAHAPPHVLFDSQHYSTLSYSSLGSYFSFLFFTFLRQFNLTYLQLKSAPRKRHWLVLTYKKNCLSFYLDETHASEMNWIRGGPPSECTKRPILGKDISEKKPYVYIIYNFEYMLNTWWLRLSWFFGTLVLCWLTWAGCCYGSRTKPFTMKTLRVAMVVPRTTSNVPLDGIQGGKLDCARYLIAWSHIDPKRYIWFHIAR